MRSFVLLAVICALAFTTSCGRSDSTGPTAPNRLSMFDAGRIVVHVYSGDQGIAGKEAEVLELGKTKSTDVNGIAVFHVPVGTYTVRVYDITSGGPALRYVDTKVTVMAGEEVRVEVFDCLLCV